MAPIQAPSQNSGTSTLAVSGVVIGLAVISCALRFYTRTLTKSGLGSDDWLLLAAVVGTLVASGLLLWAANATNPDGLWVSEILDSEYIFTSRDVFYLKLVFAVSVVYFTISGATKLAILLMYQRIFRISISFRYQLFFTSGLVIGWWVGCTIATLTNCIPLELTWMHRFTDPKTCFKYNDFWMASGACEVLLDILILTMPISVVVRMDLSLKKKLTVLGIFLLGGFTLITGLVRVILGYPRGSRVPSYSNAEVWTTVHTGMEIICASLPIFKPLLKRVAAICTIRRISDLVNISKKKESVQPPKEASNVFHTRKFFNVSSYDEQARPANYKISSLGIVEDVKFSSIAQSSASIDCSDKEAATI